MEVVASCLAALYLRGVGAASVRRRWPLVLGCLRVAAVSTRAEAIACLRSEGLDDEASALGDERIWEWAVRLVEDGQVVTAACAGYPDRWRLTLGSGAPAAVWASGCVGGTGGLVVAIVGSREPSIELLRAVGLCAADMAVLHGASLVSGGARGVDRAATAVAVGLGVSVTEVLPCGVGVDHREGVCQMRVNPLGTPFTAAAAMERNALIYAMADVAVVFGPRFRVGGTWHGAAEALRRRLCRVMVCYEPENLGARALVALGAEWYDSALGLAQALAQPRRQAALPLAEPW